MAWATSAAAVVVLVLVAIQPRAAADLGFPPLLSPFFGGLCDSIECGKGVCKVSANHSFGFMCECNTGWRQFHIDEEFRFLPCIIPNCSLNYNCENHTNPPAPAPFPAPPNLNIFDPCMWAYCGGGSCVKTSSFEHRCDCNEGYGNLLNVTSYPCFRNCSIGADCSDLGISLSNTSAASAPGLPANGSSFGGDSFAPNNLLWLFTLMVTTLTVFRAT